METALDILTELQSGITQGGGEDEDLTFLRSTLYALQQSGIDDTNFIPSYLLSEPNENGSDGGSPPHSSSSSSSSSIPCTTSTSSPSTLPIGARAISASNIQALRHSAAESPRLEVPPTGGGAGASEATERAVKTWLLSTYCRNRAMDTKEFVSGKGGQKKGGKKVKQNKSVSNGALAVEEGDIVVTDECAKALSQRHNWRFNIIEAKRTSPNFGFLLVSCIFEDWGIFKHFRVNKSTLRRFVQKISLGYHPNPYHNFTHALDVFQTLHCLLRAVPEGVFDRYEIFALLIAALVHDLGHDGYSNSFHVRTFSQRALDHNDCCPQENHHLKLAFQILNKENFDFLSGVIPAEERARMREMIIHTVLHTEMARHFELESQIKTFLSSKGVEEIGESKDSKKMLGAVLLHLADISNPTKSFGVAKYWVCNQMNEMYIQGREEEELEAGVSPMCGRETGGLVPAAQMSFINLIVLPFLLAVGPILGGEGEGKGGLMKEVMGGLKENVVRWGRLDGKSVDELVRLGCLPSGGGAWGGGRGKGGERLVMSDSDSAKKSRKKKDKGSREK